MPESEVARAGLTEVAAGADHAGEREALRDLGGGVAGSVVCQQHLEAVGLNGLLGEGGEQPLDQLAAVAGQAPPR